MDELLKALGIAISSIIVIILGVFFYNFALTPRRIYNENKEKIKSLKETNNDLATPTITIKHNESYHYEPTPYMCGEIKLIIEEEEKRGKPSDHYRLCRILIHNSSLNTGVENVQVKLTEISPPVPELNEKLPIILKFKDDISPFEPKHINANDKEFVDVVKYVFEAEPFMDEFYCICGRDKEIKFPLLKKETYKIKIEVTSENTLGDSKCFNFSMKNKDNTHNKVWLEETT